MVLGNHKLLFSMLVHGFLGYSPWFYLSVLNPMENWIKDFANASVSANYDIEVDSNTLVWLWSITSSSIGFGGIIGALTMHIPAEKLGRRYTVMLLRNIILMFGALIQGASRMFNRIELLIIGRILTGIAAIQSQLITMYIAECSPTDVRGLASSFPTIGKNVWFVIGGLLALAGSETNWHLMLMVPLIFAILHLFAAPLLPESPKHLFLTEDDEEQAKRSISFYHGKDVPIESVLKEFQAEAEKSHMDQENVASLKQIFKTKHFRWPFILCLFAGVIMPFGGLDLVTLYSTGILQNLGVDPSKAPIFTVFLIQVPSLILSVAFVLLLHHVGRRPMFLTACGLMVSGTVLLAFVTPLLNVDRTLSNVIRVISMSMILAGVGGDIIGPLLPGELAPQACRSTCASAYNAGDWVFALPIWIVYPYFIHTYGSYAILPLAIPGMFILAFFVWFLPETKGKTVSEVIEKWKN